MLKVGLTGGLGSGKSTASQFFESMGAYVLDADVTAKELIDNNKDVQKELVKEFGTDIIDASEKIEKKKCEERNWKMCRLLDKPQNKLLNRHKVKSEKYEKYEERNVKKEIEKCADYWISLRANFSTGIK